MLVWPRVFPVLFPTMTKPTRPLALALLLAALHSPPALASDPTGMITALSLIFVVAPWTLVSFLTFVVIGLGGFYTDRARAVRHARVGAIGPGIGLAVAALEFANASPYRTFRWTDYGIVPGVLAAATAITSLPMAIHKFIHST